MLWSVSRRPHLVKKESAEELYNAVIRRHKKNFSVTADIEIDNMPIFRENRLMDALFIGVHASVHAHVHGRGYEVTWTTCTSSEPPPQAK